VRIFLFSFPRTRSTSGIAEKPRKAKRITQKGEKKLGREIYERFEIFIFEKYSKIIEMIVNIIRKKPSISPFLKVFEPK